MRFGSGADVPEDHLRRLLGSPASIVVGLCPMLAGPTLRIFGFPHPGNLGSPGARLFRRCRLTRLERFFWKSMPQHPMMGQDSLFQGPIRAWDVGISVRGRCSLGHWGGELG